MPICSPQIPYWLAWNWTLPPYSERPFVNCRSYVVYFISTDLELASHAVYKSEGLCVFILMNLPYRYDLPNSIAVNRIITTLNRKLKKTLKAFPYTYLMETDNTRTLFTNHGLHMNKSGKQLVTCHIATLLYSTFEQKKSPPISLSWYELQNSNYPAQKDNQIISITRNSSRNKRLPVTRSDDFLWKA